MRRVIFNCAAKCSTPLGKLIMQWSRKSYCIIIALSVIFFLIQLIPPKRSRVNYEDTLFPNGSHGKCNIHYSLKINRRVLNMHLLEGEVRVLNIPKMVYLFNKLNVIKSSEVKYQKHDLLETESLI